VGNTLTRQPRILALDDDAVMRSLFVIAFRNLPVDLMVAENEPEARHFVEVSPPDLLLTDFHLDGKNGVEVAESILESTGKRIPIIVVTAEMVDEIDPYVRSGRCLGYIVKPIGLSTFGSEILRYLNMSTDGIESLPAPMESNQSGNLGVTFLKDALAKIQAFSLRADPNLFDDGLLIRAAHQWAGASGIDCLPDVEAEARTIEKLVRADSSSQIPDIRRLLGEITGKFEHALTSQIG
jgi:two-component system, chemotaxis family, chemotaxis protein CheY